MNTPTAQLITAHPTTWAYVSCSTRLRPDQIKASIDDAFERLSASIARAGLSTHGAPRACYHYRSDGGMGFDLGYPIASADAAAALAAGLNTGATFSGPALKATHQGPYQTLRGTYQALEKELKARGFEAGGDIWEVYLNDPDDTPPEKLVTEIAWPVFVAA